MNDRISERDDRGQLILVTGLAVAVTLVAMVLLLNTVIYTQNLATRGAQIEDGEALAVRGEIVADVGGLLDAENREDHADWAEARDNVEQATFRYDYLLSSYHGERGSVAEIERGSLSLTEGVIVRQTNASRNFTNADGDVADWTLAEDVGAAEAPGLRNVRLTVSEENLTPSSGPAGFSVGVAGNDGDDWQAFVYNDDDTTDGDDHTGVTVAVKNGSEGSATEVCSADGPEATVDLTRGTINGSPCPGIVWAKGIDAPYDVSFRNPDEAIGTYELTVNASESSPVVESNFADAGATELPRTAAAVYAAEFEIHFETPRLIFHTSVRIVPGEPR